MTDKPKRVVIITSDPASERTKMAAEQLAHLGFEVATQSPDCPGHSVVLTVGAPTIDSVLDEWGPHRSSSALAAWRRIFAKSAAIQSSGSTRTGRHDPARRASPLLNHPRKGKGSKHAKQRTKRGGNQSR